MLRPHHLAVFLSLSTSTGAPTFCMQQRVFSKAPLSLSALNVGSPGGPTNDALPHTCRLAARNNVRLQPRILVGCAWRNRRPCALTRTRGLVAHRLARLAAAHFGPTYYRAVWLLDRAPTPRALCTCVLSYLEACALRIRTRSLKKKKTLF